MPSLSSEKKFAGYCEWNPRSETRHWMSCVLEILQVYRDYWPLTIRQIFYRLVANYEYEKTEQAYGRLINYLGRARRAGWIPFEAIRDDGAIVRESFGYDSPQDWAAAVQDSANRFRLTRMNDQDVRVDVFCEAAGMVPLLSNAVEKYGVHVYSGGGFNSLTTVKATAARITADERDTVILNFGDCDPSGESIFESFRQDVEMFCSQETGGFVQVEFKRVALTEEQVDDMGIPTAPPKATDSRSKNWVGDTAQLEAIPPDDLTQMAIDAVEAELDLDALEQTTDREERLSTLIVPSVARLIEGLGNFGE